MQFTLDVRSSAVFPFQLSCILVNQNLCWPDPKRKEKPGRAVNQSNTSYYKSLGPKQAQACDRRASVVMQ